MADKLRLIVCQELELEIRSVLTDEPREDVQLELRPARCGDQHPGPSTPENNSAALPEADDFIRLIGCDCFKKSAACQGTPSLPGQPAIRQCFELLAGKTLIDSLQAEGAYLLTPGWLRTWAEHLQHWGFDELLARQFFAESAARLVLLDTGVDPGSTTRLQAFAEFVDRPFQVVQVGLDTLRLFVRNVFLEFRLHEQTQRSKMALDNASRNLSTFAMTHELIGQITSVQSEEQVIGNILDLFTMLFAPTQLFYLPVTEGKPDEIQSQPSLGEEAQRAVSRLVLLEGDYAWIESENRFVLRIGEPAATVGLIEVDGVAFPQHLRHYLNLSLSLSKVCGLAIRNARTYEKLQKNIGDLEQALASVKTLRGLLPMCAGCKKIRDDRGYWNQIEEYILKNSDAQLTHGLCPECIRQYFPGIDYNEIAKQNQSHQATED